jgi:hypothetical protein
VSSAILLFQYMNECHCLTVCFDQSKADENTKDDGDGEDVDITGDCGRAEASEVFFVKPMNKGSDSAPLFMTSQV